MFDSRKIKKFLTSTARRVQADALRLAGLFIAQNLLARPAVLETENRFDAYRVLGDWRMSDEVLKRRYHRIVREIHPDRLQALGASMGMIRKAEYVLAEINHAYETIARKRGLK